MTTRHYWLNGRWFSQIVDRDSGNLYPIFYPLFPCSDFYLKCGGGVGGWGGGGGVDVDKKIKINSSFHVFFAFYAICNIYRNKKNSGNKKKIEFILENLNVFFVFYAISIIFRICFIFWKY